MKRIAAVLVFVCISCEFSSAQIQKLNGRIWLPDGTIRNGYITVLKKSTTPQFIMFTDSGETTPVKYSPGDVNAFSLDNAVFISAMVSVDEAPYYTKNLFTKDSSVWVQKTIFLQVLLTGKIVLYKYNEFTDRIHFFIKKGNSQITELQWRQFKYYPFEFLGNTPQQVVTDASYYEIRTDPNYINQLAQVLGDDPKISVKDYKSVNYTEKDMLKIGERYNNDMMGK